MLRHQLRAADPSSRPRAGDGLARDGKHRRRARRCAHRPFRCRAVELRLVNQLLSLLTRGHLYRRAAQAPLDLVAVLRGRLDNLLATGAQAQRRSRLRGRAGDYPLRRSRDPARRDRSQSGRERAFNVTRRRRQVSSAARDVSRDDRAHRQTAGGHSGQAGQVFRAVPPARSLRPTGTSLSLSVVRGRSAPDRTIALRPRRRTIGPQGGGAVSSVGDEDQKIAGGLAEVEVAVFPSGRSQSLLADAAAAAILWLCSTYVIAQSWRTMMMTIAAYMPAASELWRLALIMATVCARRPRRAYTTMAPTMAKPRDVGEAKIETSRARSPSRSVTYGERRRGSRRCDHVAVGLSHAHWKALEKDHSEERTMTEEAPPAPGRRPGRKIMMNLAPARRRGSG